MNSIVIIVFALYLVVLLLIGYIADIKYSKKYEDFIAGVKSSEP